ncbi:MAG: peptidylprolyl isomerase [Bacteroidia bacterium]|nr:peptidylprolyl isomerase [Bacteroidia bacterium]
MKKLFSILIISFLSFLMVKAQNKETVVHMKTDMGIIKMKLYNETPKHRDNIIKLINQKYYDGMLFHRVIKDFMIQTGDPDSKNAARGTFLGNGGPSYTIPAEFNPKLVHKRGALAAARLGDDMNPKKESSGSQFYIVQGKIFSEQELAQMEFNMNQQAKNMFYISHINKPENFKLKNKVDSLNKAKDANGINKIVADLDNTIGKGFVPAKFTAEQKKIYTTVGGSPHLDGSYTIFGEVLEGMDIVDKISSVKVDQNSRPLDNIKIIGVEIVR